jgi:hypothetical protein
MKIASVRSATKKTLNYLRMHRKEIMGRQFIVYVRVRFQRIEKVAFKVSKKGDLEK